MVVVMEVTVVIIITRDMKEEEVHRIGMVIILQDMIEDHQNQKTNEVPQKSFLTIKEIQLAYAVEEDLCRRQKKVETHTRMAVQVEVLASILEDQS